VIIPDGITSIGRYAFHKCDNLQFTEYGNCKYLGNENNPYHAFITVTNTSYSSYTIHEDTKVIADYAFINCGLLIEAKIPDTINYVSNGMFESCYDLTSAVIHDSVTSIGERAFYACNSLASVTIGNSVTSIGEQAFGQCNSLKGIVIPNSVTTLGSDAFERCNKLTNVVIGDSVTSISERAFNYCTSLTKVTIGNSVTSIGDYAFNECTSLTSVYYKGTKSDWAEIEIGTSNFRLTNATRYYYSESAPTTEGNFWHYDEHGNPVAW
jgi:hypothetical protein